MKIPDEPLAISINTKKATPFKTKDITHYVTSYAPYIYIWVCRLSSIALAYYYHSIPALVLLTWVLLSLILSISPFVNFTVAVINPIFTLFFLFQYLVNIPGLFFA